MCGIVGVLDSAGLGPKELATFARALEVLEHRGPDDSGVAGFSFARIGHVRLSIIDLSGGKQPMSTEDKKLWITYNGEIYNFKAIRKTLCAKGHKFQTRSDTEVLLKAYREYGPDCLQHLNGMFAFAIVDVEKRELFLARDRLGIKPLYYAIDGERLIFSSELKSFKTLMPHSLEIEHEGLDSYLAVRYCMAPNTLLKGVKKLEAGHFLVWKAGKVVVEKQYWDIPCDTLGPTDREQAKEQLKSLLADAVRLRLISDVPLGVMLSGGLDSTIITAIMNQTSGSKIKTFSIATSGGGDWDERPFARLVADRFETDHNEIEVDPQTYLGSLERFTWNMDDLVADPASVLLFHVSQLARQHVTVALSGEGSDELFAGYSYFMLFKGWLRQQCFNSVPRLLMPLFNIPARRSTRLAGYVGRYRKSKAMYASECWGVAGGGLSSEERAGLMHTEIASMYGRSQFELTWPTFSESSADTIIEDCLYADCKTWLPDNLLTKADRMSMANSLELRVPFLDHRVVEFIFSLPLQFKLKKSSGNDYVTKVLLREAFSDDIPQEILHRKKQGFSLNWQEIVCNNNGKNMARDVLLSSRFQGLFNLNRLEQIIDDANATNSHSAQAIFSLLLFGLWHRHFWDH